MERQEISKLLIAFKPYDDNESEMRERFISLLSEQRDISDRECYPGHLTSSAIILDKSMSKILLVHHKKLERWLQPGGHLENDINLQAAAIREAYEETGIRSLTPLLEGIFDLDIHQIPARASQPEHYHYDVRFLFVVKNTEAPVHDPGETLGAEWVSLDKIFEDGYDEPFIRVAKKIKLLNIALSGS
jgi:8-oxo-dGTP pyrophosphatase MutT (NUDIX family)